MKDSKFSVDTRCTLSLNDDREDATWQYERGKRYGNARKAKAKQKRSLSRKTRRMNKIWLLTT